MLTDSEYARAVELLQHGGLVAIPTETVYGLGANALNPAAVARIYAAKGRPATSPLIVHVSDVAMARALAREWPLAADILAKRFWPGPLTLVVKKIAEIPDSVTAGLDTVGLRVPAHPVALEVIRRSGLPLAAPSANRFTQVSPTTADHVRQSLGSAVDYVLDGGTCPVGIESTVVSVATEQPLLLRPGMISQAQIEEALGMQIGVGTAGDGAHAAPGMHRKHYSPRTRTLVTHGALPEGRGAYVWWKEQQAAALNLRLPADVEGYARGLYDALHQADAAELDWIAVEAVPESAEWAAVRDRVQRASVPD